MEVELDQGCASFEASLCGAPQDEDIKGLPHGEERRGEAGARLEPRTAPMQSNSCPASQPGPPQPAAAERAAELARLAGGEDKLAESAKALANAGKPGWRHI